MLYPQHERTVARLVDLFADDPRYLGLIVGGSLVKGYGNETSDVDIMLVATDAAYAECVAAQDYWYFNRELCDYPEGYVDGKIIDVAFLHDVADHGSEPARWAFKNALLPFSHAPELATLVAQIPVYPEAEREQKMLAFFTHAQMMTWFAGEAEKRANAYLMMHAVSKLVLYCGRLLLAYNRILYPYHKWFLRVLDEAPDKPADVLARIDTVLQTPSQAHAEALFACVRDWRDWGIPPQVAPGRFMIDSEWTWRNGRAPVEDW